MVKRPDDETPEPPGGRAAERQKMFQEARGKKRHDSKVQKKKKSANEAKKLTPEKVKANEKQKRSKD